NVRRSEFVMWYFPHSYRRVRRLSCLTNITPIKFWKFRSRPVVTAPRLPSSETPVWRQTRWHRRRRIWDLCGLHDGVKCVAVFPTPLPDDPQKWEGWSKYNSTNPYERLCLDAEE